ncbi:type II toxin-antitoxin system toxin endoribonuclease MazF3 [soil metagenome]
MKRGEVRWYTFKAPDKRRPVLVLTRNSSIGVLNAITVAPITSTIRDVPSEVLLDENDGLTNECAANLHSLQTVPKANLGPLITTLSGERLREVEEAVRFSLGFEELV